ncbi:MAG: hypothetical protein ACK5GN_07245 [Pseudomonadota bacterium]|jgi:hypothetical protein
MPTILTLTTLTLTLITFCTLIASSAAAPRVVRSKTTQNQVAPALTRLRAQQPVVVQQVMKGGGEVRHANVEVSNVGSAVASGIQVYIEQSGGVAYVLRGPSKLHPRERGVYTLRSRVMAGPGSWRVVTRCTTCRR